MRASRKSGKYSINSSSTSLGSTYFERIRNSKGSMLLRVAYHEAVLSLRQATIHKWHHSKINFLGIKLRGDCFSALGRLNGAFCYNIEHVQ